MIKIFPFILVTWIAIKALVNIFTWNRITLQIELNSIMKGIMIILPIMNILLFYTTILILLIIIKRMVFNRDKYGLKSILSTAVFILCAWAVELIIGITTPFQTFAIM